MGPKIKQYFVRYKREFVITVILKTEFDCIHCLNVDNSSFKPKFKSKIPIPFHIGAKHFDMKHKEEKKSSYWQGIICSFICINYHFFTDRLHCGWSKPCSSTCLLSPSSRNQPETDSPSLHVSHVSGHDLSGPTHPFPSGCTRGETMMNIKPV